MRNTAVIISYDDSDGWYDHAMPPIVSQSNTPDDSLVAPGSCGVAPAGSAQGCCGYGPRLPLLVISPWARATSEPEKNPPADVDRAGPGSSSG
jgi:phospholipase C